MMSQLEIFQKHDGVFARAKGFDTFCPIGPAILRSISLEPRRVRCWVNEECRQDGNTDDCVSTSLYWCHLSPLL